jgi:hypothetical protein
VSLSSTQSDEPSPDVGADPVANSNVGQRLLEGRVVTRGALHGVHRRRPVAGVGEKVLEGTRADPAELVRGGGSLRQDDQEFDDAGRRSSWHRRSRALSGHAATGTPPPTDTLIR